MNHTADQLKQLFSNSFNNEQWTTFLHGFFGADTLYTHPKQLGNRDGDTGYLLGEFTTADHYKVGLFRFDIAHGSVLRRKSGLRALADRFLRNHGFDSAIAVFCEAGSAHWRFSYICDIKDAETHPKRFTYVFGDDTQQYRPPIERFLALQIVGISHQNILDAFAVEAIAKEFYTELFAWYERALEQVRFPADIIADESRRNAEQTIRLISRLLFCWFLKQKNIIPNEFFNKAQADNWLNYTDATGSTYYKAILQNLFFATLNLDPNEAQRIFINDNRNYQVIGCDGYRYKRFFRPGMADQFVATCATIPFLNGGLFECLDKDREDRAKVRRLDCFSNLKANEPLLAVPDTLFFDPQSGLFPLLNRYNFTVEENTPLDQEVALDPELLGKVFENLLASYNPETGATARKQTGSFYTPREIVDYMADAAITAALGEKLPEKTSREKIFSLKILDPACGSGAFPMGILTRLLEILDPAPTERYATKLRLIENCIYGVDIQPIAVQIAKLRCFISLVCDWPDGQTPPLPNLENNFVCANTLVGISHGTTEALGFSTDDAELIRLRTELRDTRHRHFSARHTSEKKRLRKIDASLRSAISDRLVAIAPRPDEQRIEAWQREIVKLKKEVTAVAKEQWEETPMIEEERDLLGNIIRQAGLPQLVDVNKGIREELSQKLKSLENSVEREKAKIGNSPDFAATAARLAAWDPYDQNATSAFFDPEWMFGIKEGFDIVIGNPPYVRADEQSEWNREQRQAILASRQYETLWEKWDLFIPFLERGYKLLRDGGVSALIVSDAYCHSKYAQQSQNWFLTNSRVLRLDFCGDLKIFDAAVHNIIPFFQKADGTGNTPERRLHKETFGNITFLPTNKQQNLTYRTFFPNETQTAALSTFTTETIPLADICYISYGLAATSDEKHYHKEFTTGDLVQDYKDEKHPKPYCEGKHIGLWIPQEIKWLEWGTKRAPHHFRRKSFSELLENEKILVQRSPGPDPKCCFDSIGIHFTDSSVGFVPWHSLAGVRNNSLKKAARYEGEKPSRPDLSKREQLEENSRRFDIKFLLGVMNSTVARNYLRAHRRSNIHLYPDDWKRLPIPDVPPARQAPIAALVDRILTAKRANPDADIAAMEGEIDALVTELYNIGEPQP